MICSDCQHGLAKTGTDPALELIPTNHLVRITFIIGHTVIEEVELTNVDCCIASCRLSLCSKSGTRK